jgi:hypothetical protein
MSEAEIEKEIERGEKIYESTNTKKYIAMIIHILAVMLIFNETFI